MRSMLLVLLLLTSTLGIAEAQSSPDIPEMAAAPVGGDFTLDSADGPVSLKDFRDKVTLIYFGYTKCPDVCPTSLAILTQALNAFSDSELKKIQGLFVSVDPERDTLPHLKEYASYFHDNLKGITGSEEAVAKVAEQYGAQYYKVELEGSSFGYAVNHSSVTYLVTPDGTLRFVFPHNTPASVLVEATRHVLAGN